MSLDENVATAVIAGVAAVDANDQLQTTKEEQHKLPHRAAQQQMASEPNEETRSEDSNSGSPSNLLKRPPKMRLKLSMRKLPTQANRKPLANGSPNAPDQINSDDDEPKAMIVDSDDGGEDHAIALAVLDEPASTANHSGATSTKPPKRRSVSNSSSNNNNNTSRQIRLPPIASPGLYMALPSMTPKEKLAKNGFIAPADVFDHHMEQAGYTMERRTKSPHRGSSVKRTIGDMFDSNVALTQRFPPLIPPRVGEHVDVDADTLDIDGEHNGNDVRQRLINALSRKAGQQASVTNEAGKACKRRTAIHMKDMVPISLTIPLPEEYVRKQIQYVQDVKRREEAIVEYQEAVFNALASRSDDGVEDKVGKIPADPLLPTVPAIPDPPTPPRLTELSGSLVELYHDIGKGHIYLPKGKEDFVAHLDPKCFHITEGRYFGLESNLIADPNFVGPNAPGIAGINASGGSGLATSSSGGGISGAMALTLSTTYNGTTAGSAAVFRIPGTSPAYVNFTQGVTKTASSFDAANGFVPDLANMLEDDHSAVKPTPQSIESKDIGPPPTSSFSDLKKIFDDNAPILQSMKDCIIKSAVHASRSGHHGVSWLGPDGERYPDISKAFATYAGIRPCQRCKSNKQGAYHCRLRRTHKEADHDGGNSFVVLSTLLLAPMESLLLSQ
ncbi:hypothetical protein MPSEU_000490300 [Mayamaea pseudoterrestris]|nr:hypothetical protein MPSEU_000490300 [Mayamaea pseudoterrestris]